MVGYGIVQDQVSARLCPEYFTLFHPPIEGLTDPTLLGATWGFLGTWWGGLLLGYLAGLFATLGSKPKLAPREFLRPVAILLAFVGSSVATAGVSVWRHAALFGVSIDPGLARMLPTDEHRWLLVVACYHFVGYASAIAGGVVLCVWIGRERDRRNRIILRECDPQSTRPPGDIV
jgi:hypothetical protein